jgi:hypothetical protein
MINVERYKITVKGDDKEYRAHQNGKFTYIEWRTKMGHPFCLTHPTNEVIKNLRDGLWRRVPTKKDIEKNHKKAPNLFSLDDL